MGFKTELTRSRGREEPPVEIEPPPSIRPQRHDGVDSGSLPPRQICGGEGDSGQDDSDRGEGPWIGRADAVEEGGHHLGEDEGGSKAEGDSQTNQGAGFPYYQEKDRARPRPESHAQTDFPRPLCHRVGSHSIDPNYRERQREAGKEAEQEEIETPRGKRI